MRWLGVLLGILVAGRALAWDSRCYLPGGAECHPGPEAARNRWVGASDEHRALWEFSRIFGGLPTVLSQPFDLTVFTGGALVDVAGAPLPTFEPVNFVDAGLAQVRTMTAGEFAQLPDHAYALWDWVRGNETCPLDAALPLPVGAQACHDFATHMGPVNANHFLPQGAFFYDHYHQLALARAAACVTMATRLGAAASRFPEFLHACEQQAFVLEAIGQHYLQDAWATGHMWERWGSPDLADFPSLTHALLVAMTSGLIHGARAVLDALALDPATAALGLTEYDFDDALNAPHPAVQWLGPVDPTPHPGLGDLYLTNLLEGQGASVPDQYRLLFSCGAAGLRAVYRAAGEREGPLSPLAPGLVAVDPTSDDCFGQRVTNAAMVQGMGLDFTLPNGAPVRVELDSALATNLVPQLSQQAGGNPSAAMTTQFQIDVARIVSIARLTALAKPDEATLASGVLPPLLGISANGAYVKSPLATYVDPPLPWPPPSGTAGADAERAAWLGRTFHRAHAREWCNRFRAGDPGLLDVAALRAKVATLRAAGAADARIRAACAACGEFAARHLRVGRDSTDYDMAREPLCHFLADDPTSAQYVYQPDAASSTVPELASAYCGCGGRAQPAGRSAMIRVLAGSSGNSNDTQRTDAPPAFTTFGPSPLAVQSAAGGAQAEATASQTSSIMTSAGGDLESVPSHASITASQTTTRDDNGFANSEAAFTLSFEVTDQPVHYSVSGTLNASVLGNPAENGAGAGLRLLSEVGEVFTLVVGDSDFGSGPSTLPLMEEGTLSPGVYELTAAAVAGADSNEDAGETGSSGSNASWDFTLTLGATPP